MIRSHVRTAAALSLVAGAFTACARVVRPTAGPPDSGTRQLAALDSASVRRLCVAPDSVLAQRASCVLRDQRPPIRIF